MIESKSVSLQKFAGPLLILMSLIAVPAAFGQGGGGRAAGPPPGPAAKNLKLLAAKTDIPFVMQTFTKALGVQCTYCHVQGDFASDENPKKAVARDMILMVRQIGLSFPSTADQFPDGYSEVDCMTCHRGSTKPETKAAHQFFNRGESARGTPNPSYTPGVNIQVLPLDTQVHGGGSVMESFRDALGVDCSYCHGGGVPQQRDMNPRKEIARGMIAMVRQINAHFPGTGVYPVGPQEVTCYTCHRGEPHPLSVSNTGYPPFEKK